MYIRSKIMDKLISPCLMRINDLTDFVIQENQFTVDADKRSVLRVLYVFFYGFYDFKVLAVVINIEGSLLMNCYSEHFTHPKSNDKRSTIFSIP